MRRAKYAEGIAHRTGHALPGAGGPRKLPDDVTLAQKVESTAFRKSRVPKERVSVNSENGVVFLRGQLENEQQIQALVHAVAAVDGVREVKSLLHTPSGTTPAGP